jgi:2,3-bisphosphoglycerate-independent phosphoglycerate mutase
VGSKKAFLIILDGWGLSENKEVSAISQANTPFVDECMSTFPMSTLTTFGEDVGLPEGQMGNSEVGHLNIGAGRVVYQELARINKNIRDGEFENNALLRSVFENVQSQNSVVHIMGLLSDGGVHSHIEHLKALLKVAGNYSQSPIYLHAFMDGRDTDPKSGKAYLNEILPVCEVNGVELATLIGRYYAMDRDNRWERVKETYDLLVHKHGKSVDNWSSMIQYAYEQGLTDEFLKGHYLSTSGFEGIKNGDTVIFFNFRTDRPRELVEVLSQKDLPEYSMHKLDLNMLTFTRYDERYEGVKVLFEKEDLTTTLGEWVSAAGKTQLRIAETEKYPHVTFFFSGGREKTFGGEERILIRSPKVPTYDLQPEMSAFEIRDAIVGRLKHNPPDLIVLNFANTDMVGHTGVFEAGIAAAEAVDQCLETLVPLARQLDYELLIIADHGNADTMINPDGSPNTAHTMNPVPCIYIGSRSHLVLLEHGRLADVAPTLLDLMELPKPEIMKGKSLLRPKE